MKVLVLVLLLAGSCFGQIETDCREVYAGKIRCYSTDNRIQRPMGNNRIQIPDYAGENLRRDQARSEGLRRAIETRARIDQMRSQVLLNNALTEQLSLPAAAAPAPTVTAPKAHIDFIEVLDYAKTVFAREKAKEISIETSKSLVNLRANEWVANMRARGVSPEVVRILIESSVKDIRALRAALVGN